MVTFTLICIGLSAIACLIVSALIVLGVLTCGILAVVLDVILGVLPFVLVGALICWLFRRKEKRNEEQCCRSGSESGGDNH